MKKTYLTLLLVCVSLAIHAQITVSGSTGSANGSYTSFTNVSGVFAALNTAGSHNAGDAITISITADVLAETGTNGLNAGTWNSITITPTGARTISGAAAGGAPLINFNGADKVTIDGLNSGGNSLTISNTTVSAVSGTSTIRFIGGATNNVVTNCSVLGSSSSDVSVNGGNIFFSTDALTANGNDNNTISNCTIGPAGVNLPSKGVYGNGSGTTTAIGNSGNLITNNNFADIFNTSVSSAGLYIAGGCNGWTISNNRFYQTATRTWTAGVNLRGIELNSTAATSGVQGFTITGNTIGYASSAQTGTYTVTGSSGKFAGIRFNGISGGTSSTISNNTIAEINISGVVSSGTTASTPFACILIDAGPVVANSNIMGNQNFTGSVQFSTNTGSGTDMYGIFNVGVDNFTSSGNQMGSITFTNANTAATSVFYGIRCWTSNTTTWTAIGNIIGGTVPNSIQVNSLGASSQVIGLNMNAPATTMNNNTIRNLSATGGTGLVTIASVIGILSTGTGVNNTLSQNEIYGLTNSNATLATAVTGIQYNSSSGLNIVEKCMIYGLTNASNNAAAEINGIRTAGGNVTYRNNMIALGNGVPNAMGTTPGTGGISGINEVSGVNNFYHNSVYIGGAPTAGAGPSYAFKSIQTLSTRSFRDNIFYNARSNNGATGKNYVVRVGGSGLNPTGLTINNNAYFSTGAGAVFGFYNSLDVASFAAWKATIGQDAASFFGDPAFTSPNSATPDLHINTAVPTVVEANGADVGVTDDFDGETRASLTPVDIGADADNFIPAVPMSYVSSTSVQQTGTVCAGNSNVPVLRMEVVTTGNINPLTLTSLTINGTGTTSLADVAAYRIYYTGTSPVFNTSTPIIAATPGLTAANIVVTPSGLVILATGTNYFWLTYDLNGTATGPSLDGAFTNVALSTGGGVPTVTAPAGTVTLNAQATANAGGNRAICLGNTLQLAGSATNNTGVNWTSSGSGSFTNGNTLSPIYTPTIADGNIGTITLTVTATGNAPCGNTSSNMTLTINPTSATLAATGSSQSLQLGGTAVFTSGSCQPIAGLFANGASPVSGSVTSKVTVENSVLTYNNDPYLQRHFDIEPATAPSTSTGTVTLYATQAEFDAYNAANGGYPDLPTGPVDFAGIANLRVSQWHGTGTTPGTYTGSEVLIDPVDASIQWDATHNWWVITFPVTGFSGFFIHTVLNGGPLPVSLLRFAGYKEGSHIQLKWTTATEQDCRGFEVERSTDGVHFSSIGFVNSQAVGGNSNSQLEYVFTDNNPVAGHMYYRLRQLEADNSGRYSQVILLTGDKPVMLSVGGIYPNPVKTDLKVLVSSPVRELVTVYVTDMAGRTMLQQQEYLETGSNSMNIKVDRLTSGTYLVKLISNDSGEIVTRKFVKQ